MKTTDFAYWLQGYFEILEAGLTKEEKEQTKLNSAQVEIIKNHLNLVFLHDIDPKSNKGSSLFPEDLQKIHDGFSKPKWNSDSKDPKVRC